MKTLAKSSARGALTLLAFSLVFTALMAGTYMFTRDRVTANEKAARIALLAQVLPAGSFDNDLAASAAPYPAADGGKLGNGADAHFYRAQKSGKTVAVVLETLAPDGYAGPIKLLVGIDPAGMVLGVRVIAHKETPGLGDYIDAAKSAWINVFAGKSLQNPPDGRWKVRKDGGDFDYIAGATISPRAVVKAVHQALAVVAANRAAYFGGAAS